MIFSEKVGAVFGEGLRRWLGNGSWLFNAVSFSEVFGAERLVWSPARYRKLKIWSPRSPDGAKLRLVGWLAFALRRRFWSATAGFVSPLPDKAGADVFGQAGWERQRLWRLRRRLVGQVLGNWGALVGNGRLSW